VVDWVAVDIQSKALQNLASDHPLALASKAEGSEAALVVAVAASVEASEVIEAVLVVTEVALVVTEVALAVTEAALAGIEVGSAAEGALVTKVQVASEAEEDSQTVHPHQMRQADLADREAVGMVLATDPVLPTVLDLTMATGAVAMGMVLVVNEIIVAAPAARQGLTAVEINVVE
jgi:hypothetical protein